MSMNFNGVVGYGINVENLYSELDNEKVITFLKEFGCYEEGYEDITEYVNGQPFYSIAEAFGKAGHSYLFYDDTDEGSYLYFPALLPWEVAEEETSVSKNDVETINPRNLLE